MRKLSDEDAEESAVAEHIRKARTTVGRRVADLLKTLTVLASIPIATLQIYDTFSNMIFEHQRKALEIRAAQFAQEQKEREAKKHEQPGS